MYTDQRHDRHPNTHPIHSRGVRSAWPNTSVRGLLTDAQIHRYALQGYYGSAKQALAQRVEASKARAKAKKQTPTDVAAAVNLINQFLHE